MTRDYAALASAYTEGVTDGRILSCHWVKQAVQRHLSDLQRQDTPDFPYHFDQAKATRVLTYIERLPHIKGPLAGQPVVLEPYQIWMIGTLFGWMCASGKKAGKRRFRRAYIELPRSSGKSFISSAISLYMLTADGEGGSDCYSAATTRDQARIVYDSASAMARSPVTKNLMAHLGVQVNAHTIIVPKTNSRLLPLSAEANSLEGLSIHFCSVDETHAHKTRDVWDAIVLGAGKRDQSLVLGITTAGFDLAGIGFELHVYATQVLDRVVYDETQFACIWTIDRADDWQDPLSWRKANPGLGVSTDEDYFMSIARESVNVPSKQSGFKTKYLNIWLSNHSQYFDMPSWEQSQDKTLDIAHFRGKSCYMGLDLGAKTDMACKCLIFPENGHFYLFPQFYLPEAAVFDGRNSQYKGWTIDGHIRATSGNILDFDEIERDIVADLGQFDVLDIGIDPWESTQLVQKLLSQGAVVTEIMQTVSHLSEPTKELDAISRSGRLHYDSPVMFWCASNVVCREDTNGNVKPNKASADQKIDGIIAAVLGLARYLVHENQTSIYEEEGRGILVF